MQFNFNLGAVRTTYENHRGQVYETLIFNRAEFDYIEAHHTLLEATQTTIKGK